VDNSEVVELANPAKVDSQPGMVRYILQTIQGIFHLTCTTAVKLSPKAQEQVIFISPKPQAEALFTGHYSSPCSIFISFSLLQLRPVEEVTCPSSRQ
jgi:hypothetical protein